MTVRKSATENGFIVFKDQLSLLKLIPDEQLGKAIKLLLENFDELPEMNNIAYEMLATNVRRYREQSTKARESGLKGGNPTLKGMDKGTDNPTLKLQEKKRKENTKQKNIIPSLQEVIDYCNERNNGVDANKWFDYYTANGWKVGRNPMKDWKATVRTWERNESKPAEKEKTVLIERGKFYIDDTEQYSEGYSDLVKAIPEQERNSLWEWFMSKFEGQELKLSFIRSVLMKKQGGM